MMIEIIKFAYSFITMNNLKIVASVTTPQNIITLSTLYQTTKLVIKIMEILEFFYKVRYYKS